MEAATSSQMLCRFCGFCCDGTLFESVPISADDALAPLQAAGIEIRTAAPKRHFAQPCGAHREGRCYVYENRPASCRTYRCELLKKCERGDVSWHDAQERIGRVKALKDSIAAEVMRIVPDGDQWPVAIVSTLMPTQQDFRADRELLETWAPVMLRLAALRDCLQQYFRPPRATGEQPSNDSQISREVDS